MSRSKVATQRILDDATTVAAGSSFQPWGSKKTFECSGTTTSGTGAATVKVQGSNTGDIWKDIFEFNLTLSTTRSGETHEADAPWKFVRAEVTVISGTGATTRVDMGNTPGF